MTVRTEDDEVFDVGAVELDRTVNEIIEAHRARWDFEADRARRAITLASGDHISRQRATGAIVFPRVVGSRHGRSADGITLRFQFFRRAVAVVGMTIGNEPVGHGAVAIAPPRL